VTSNKQVIDFKMSSLLYESQARHSNLYSETEMSLIHFYYETLSIMSFILILMKYGNYTVIK